MEQVTWQLEGAKYDSLMAIMLREGVLRFSNFTYLIVTAHHKSSLSRLDEWLRTPLLVAMYTWTLMSWQR